MSMERIATSEEVCKGEMLSVTVNGTRLLLSRIDGEVKGVVDKCTHLGMPMRRGKFDGRIGTCPFHNSRFDIATGENVDWVSRVMGAKMPGWVCKAIAMGKEPAPLTRLTIEERDGEVFAEIPVR